MKYNELTTSNYWGVLAPLDYILTTLPGAMIAGGYFRDALTNESPRDIDLFFRNAHDYNKSKSIMDGLVTEGKFKLYYSNDKVDAYLDVSSGMVWELIKMNYSSPTELLDNFDFSITKMCYYSEVEFVYGEDVVVYKLIAHPNYFEHLVSKRLVLESDDALSHAPSTWNRTYKYNKKGFNLCRESKVILITELHEWCKDNQSSLESGDLFAESIYIGGMD